MAKSRTYLVSFSPASMDARGVVTIAITQKIGENTRKVEASSFDALRAEVIRQARETGQSVSPYVRLPRGERNPPGFDAAFRNWNFIGLPEPVEA